MPASGKQSIPFDLAVLDRIACPSCRGALRLEEQRLRCTECGRAYPIVDGIPMLIAERAEAAQ